MESGTVGKAARVLCLRSPPRGSAEWTTPSKAESGPSGLDMLAFLGNSESPRSRTRPARLAAAVELTRVRTARQQVPWIRAGSHEPSAGSPRRVGCRESAQVPIGGIQPRTPNRWDASDSRGTASFNTPQRTGRAPLHVSRNSCLTTPRASWPEGPSPETGSPHRTTRPNDPVDAGESRAERRQVWRAQADRGWCSAGAAHGTCRRFGWRANRRGRGSAHERCLAMIGTWERPKSDLRRLGTDRCHSAGDRSPEQGDGALHVSEYRRATRSGCPPVLGFGPTGTAMCKPSRRPI